MSSIDKLKDKFYEKPIPNDISYADVKRLAENFGCIVDHGEGRHSLRVVYPPLGIAVPIPVHGNNVGEIYIKELKKLFARIVEEERR